MPQGRLLFPSLTVEQHLGFAASRSQGQKKTWALKSVYDLFPELQQRSKVGGGRLSGGEQQMLSVDRALVTTPTLLLMEALN